MSDGLGGSLRGLLFTDLEASTVHLRALGDRYGSALARHHEIIRAAAAAHDGIEVGSEGDSLAVVLPDVGAAARAAVDAQRQLAAEPWPDSPWRVRMSVHAGHVEDGPAGPVGVALHEAARIRNVGHGGQILVSQQAANAATDAGLGELVDLGLHAVRDIEGSVRIYQLNAQGLDERFPSLKTGDRVEIPRSLTSFVERGDEVRRVVEALDGDRIVTLVGPGGSGKTRLAFEAAARVEVGEVATVELAGLRMPEQVPSAVAAATGAADPSGVAEAIGSRALLLVLDNCEHVLAAVTDLVSELASRCPELRILCTSREPLAVSGERAWPVPSLQPDVALRLFRERAGSAVRDQDDVVIAAICARLDGLPLAIELAAARLRSIPLVELGRRLDDQLNLLTTGSRHVPRQQTMRATLDWSYDLLDDEEQQLFRRLAVFAGGFTLEAAEQVGATSSPLDVVGCLDGLVQRSLVAFDAPAARYRMLEPVRQYAGERLAEAGETAVVDEAHRTWVVAMAAHANRGLFVDQRRWTEALDAEGGNIGGAINGALAADDVRTAARIVSSLGWYWFTARRVEPVWVEQVTDRIGELEPLDVARVLLAAGIAHCDTLRDGRPLEWLAEAERSFREHDHRRGLGSALFWHGRALAMRGDLVGARRCFDEGVPLHEGLGDEFGAGWCILWQATIAKLLDRDLALAQSLLEQVIARSEAAGIVHVSAAAVAELGELAAERGDLEEAFVHADTAVRLYREVGDRWQVALALHGRAHARIESAPRLAAQDVLEALQVAEDLRSDPDLGRLLLSAAVLLVHAGRRDEAAQLVVRATQVAPPPSPATLFPTQERSYARMLGDLVGDPQHAVAVRTGAGLELRAATELARRTLTEVYEL